MICGLFIFTTILFAHAYYKTHRKLMKLLKERMTAMQELQDRSYIVSIERDGRWNKFLFSRKKEIITIETMGLIGDDLPGWKEKLLR